MSISAWMSSRSASCETLGFSKSKEKLLSCQVCWVG